MKKRILGLAAVLCASLATAEMGMYGRLDIGYSNRGVSENLPLYDGYTTNNTNNTITFHVSDFEAKDYMNAFRLMPAFGLMFAPDSDNIFMKGFGLEAQIDLNFGGKKFGDYKIGGAVINPGVMAMWHYYLPESCPVAVQKIVPYTGLGFSVPISIIKSTQEETVYTEAYWKYIRPEYSKTLVKAGFNVNFKLGCGYEIIPALMLTFDYELSFGTSVANSINIGAVYKFKGARENLSQK